MQERFSLSVQIFPNLMMGLYGHERKVCLIHLTYGVSITAQPGPACTCSERSPDGHSRLTRSLFNNKVLNTSCNALNPGLKVKMRTALWVQKGWGCLGRGPS